jgi:hypothetical protein
MASKTSGNLEALNSGTYLHGAILIIFCFSVGETRSITAMSVSVWEKHLRRRSVGIFKWLESACLGSFIVAGFMYEWIVSLRESQSLRLMDCTL